jgi:ADP-ribose pyrophosphatase YjhB (NUDIX family)
MYKVFIYNKAVFIGFPYPKTAKTYQQLEVLDVQKIFNFLKSDDCEGLIIGEETWSEVEIENCWKQFCEYFTPIIAAGGVVYNANHEILLIYRLQKWDLPKGKLEDGEVIEECAVREVEEECNVNNLKIKNALPNTYHCYPLKNGVWALKTTYWFAMETNFTGELIPQTEEGIEKVEWVKISDLQPYIDNTYPSLVDILENLRTE